MDGSAMSGFKVQVRQADAPVTVEMGQTILESALKSGVAYPHGCRSGNCGACKSRLHAGEVEMSPYSEFALSEKEKADGLILACRAVPWSDCEVSWLGEEDLIVHPNRQLRCEVADIVQATHDIRIVRLKVLSGGPFDFSCGQYAAVSFAGQPPRDYSMASTPDDPVLEFHIRRVAGGSSSAYVAEQLRVGEPVHVDGPYGTSYLRPNHRGPIVAVAGGSGLAPMKSIVEAALKAGMQQDMALYFGVRAERDLYLEDQFRALERAHPNFRFVPVLSDASGATARRTGFVHAAVAADFGDLDGCKVYTAGPPPMVRAVQEMAVRAGARPEDIHADAFYTEAEKASLTS
jgi:CDP-4-dehydro-6-deoxyglucose reductase/ferredoxin-NAD(P)+ reductase (naphthalene dioxygenase ferredoxin-specific)